MTVIEEAANAVDQAALEPKSVFSTRELAKRWGCSEKHIYRMRTGEASPRLPFFRIGNLIRYRLEDILQIEAAMAERG